MYIRSIAAKFTKEEITKSYTTVRKRTTTKDIFNASARERGENTGDQSS